MGFVRPNALQIKFPEKEQLNSNLELPRATSVLLQQKGVGVSVCLLVRMCVCFPLIKGGGGLGKGGRWSSLLSPSVSISQCGGLCFLCFPGQRWEQKEYDECRGIS